MRRIDHSAQPSAEREGCSSFSVPDKRLRKANLALLASEVYSEYPKKVAKPVALKAIEKAISTIAGRGATGNNVDFDGDLKAATEWLKSRTALYAQSPLGRRADKEHIPHPSTWYNQCRFDDDPAEWKHFGTAGGKSKLQAASESPSDGFEEILSRPAPAWAEGRQ